MANRPQGMCWELVRREGTADKNGEVNVITSTAPPHRSVPTVPREVGPGATAPIGHPLKMGLFSKEVSITEIPENCRDSEIIC